MITYRIVIAESAARSIREQSWYIRTAAGAPLEAERWVQRVMAAAESLATHPRRCPLAVEANTFREEVRRVSIDGYFLLFTIDEQSATVAIVAARHGRQLPLEPDAPE